MLVETVMASWAIVAPLGATLFVAGAVAMLTPNRWAPVVAVSLCLVGVELVVVNGVWGRPVGARVALGIVIAGLALLVLWNVEQCQHDEQAEPISDDHRHELQAIARGIRSRLPLERRAVYAPTDVDGTTPLALSFRSHFPETTTALDELNILLDEIGIARHALWDWWNDEMAAREIPRGPIVLTISGIAEATTPESQPAGFDWREVLGWMQADGSPVVSFEADDVAARTEELDALLVDALRTDECADLRRSRREVDQARRALSRDLQQIEALHVVRSRCDLCR